MSQFTVRVELHGATPEQYTVLHQRMEAYGFNRLIRGTDSSGASGWWRLPTGEYDFDTVTENAQQVRDRVKIVADSVKPGAWVLVTQVASRTWNTEKVSG